MNAFSKDDYLNIIRAFTAGGKSPVVKCTHNVIQENLGYINYEYEISDGAIIRRECRPHIDGQNMWGEHPEEQIILVKTPSHNPYGLKENDILFERNP